MAEAARLTEEILSGRSVSDQEGGVMNALDWLTSNRKRAQRTAVEKRLTAKLAEIEHARIEAEAEKQRLADQEREARKAYPAKPAGDGGSI